MALFLSQTLEIDEPEPLRLRFFSFFPVPLFACEGVGPEWFKLCSAHKHWHKMPTGPESLIPRRGGWMCYWNTQGKHVSEGHSHEKAVVNAWVSIGA